MTNTSQHPWLTEITALERRVWEAFKTGDATVDTALLCDTFLGVYPDGFAGKPDHVGQLDSGPTVNQYALDTIQIRSFGTDHALLSYRAEFQRTNSATVEVMYVTSVWERRSGTWINIFSQDTPAGKA